MNNKLPKVGDVCFFHDESLDYVLKYPDDSHTEIGEFFIIEDGVFVTRDNYGFKYCTPLGTTHEAKDES